MTQHQTQTTQSDHINAWLSNHLHYHDMVFRKSIRPSCREPNPVVRPASISDETRSSSDETPRIQKSSSGNPCGGRVPQQRPGRDHLGLRDWRLGRLEANRRRFHSSADLRRQPLLSRKQSRQRGMEPTEQKPFEREVREPQRLLLWVPTVLMCVPAQEEEGLPSPP